MKKMLLLVAAAGLLSLAAAQGGSADSAYMCTGTLDDPGFVTGMPKDVVVPPGNACILEGVTVTHDVTVQTGASLGVDNSTIGHDVKADGAAFFEFIGYTGPIHVGHDVVLTGTSPNAQSFGGYDICDATIGHDLSITGANVADEIEVGDNGPQDNEFCAFPGPQPDSIGHDVTVSNNTAGKVDVGNNSIGHDLNVNSNTASTSTSDTGGIGVDDNTVNHDATCTGNSPGLTADGPEDGPNHVGHKDTGCEAARS
ncbi:MAG TPA: hypothetical protein VLJ76_09230 [Gaiellaceae bacterium]|nr:hypothetical protein [Gaiellaceae bacterium]